MSGQKTERWNILENVALLITAAYNITIILILHGCFERLTIESINEEYSTTLRL